MRTIYEAFDGTLFYEKEDCVQYELEHEAKKINKNIILLDIHGGVINTPLLEVDFNQVFTVAINTKEAGKFLTDHFDVIGVFTPDNGFEEKAVYWWDDNKATWINTAEEIRSLEEEINFLEEKLSLLEQF